MNSPTARRIQRFGWKPSLPDPRDIVADASGLKVATEVDPRKHMPPVYDQGQLGSCTANAVGACFEYDSILDGRDFGVPARLFIYYCERMIEGSLSQGDTGAYGRDGFKALKNYGVLPESRYDYGYDISKFDRKPSAADWLDASKRKLTKQYRAVPRTLLDFKRVLSNGQTIAFGFSVFTSFDSSEVASSGVVPMPDVHSEQLQGGHEVLAVGYLKSHPHHVLVRNSWGSGWGDGGYCLMPWEILLDRNLSSDFRTIARPVGA